MPPPLFQPILLSNSTRWLKWKLVPPVQKPRCYLPLQWHHMWQFTSCHQRRSGHSHDQSRPPPISQSWKRTTLSPSWKRKTLSPSPFFQTNIQTEKQNLYQLKNKTLQGWNKNSIRQRHTNKTNIFKFSNIFELTGNLILSLWISVWPEDDASQIKTIPGRTSWHGGKPG